MKKMCKKFKKENVLYLGKLSKLELSKSEIERYAKEIVKTLEFVQNLMVFDVSAVEEYFGISDRNVTFEDGVRNLRALSQEEALANTKHKKNGFFITRRILKK